MLVVCEMYQDIFRGAFPIEFLNFLTLSQGFHKMTDGSKQKFMKAIFGEDGTSIDAGTAAALLAATCSGKKLQA